MSIQKVYETYHEDVQFLSIYIREAHPKDGWWLGGRFTKKIIGALMTDKASTEHTDPKTIKERRAVAGECATALGYGVRTYVDEIDDRVNRAYAGWPTRLYLVGLDGRIAYAGRQGPYGFKPKELEEAIVTYLGEISHAE